MYAFTPRRRRSDHATESCPMTPEQIKVMLHNQEQMMKDVADMKRYMFAGRIVVGTLVVIGLSLDWVRDHAIVIRAWILPDK